MSEAVRGTQDNTESKTQDEASPDRSWLAILKEAGRDFADDAAMTQAAATAFYTALSFAPLLMLVVVVMGLLDNVLGAGVQQRAIEEVQVLLGGEAGAVVEEVTQTADQQERLGNLWSLTGVVGLLALLWSASGVFVQLQTAMNNVWDVEPAPGQGIWGFLRSRFLSVGLIFGVLFLLLASLAVTTVLNAVLPGEAGGVGVWKVVNFGVSAAVYLVLFALIFKFLPDVRIPWPAVWFGSVVTAGLFLLGKSVIGLYLGTSNPGTSYGAAGSVVVLLVWVYYSAVIVFFGAELTQVWAKHSGYRIRPDEHAQPQTANAKQSAVRQKDDAASDNPADESQRVEPHGGRKDYELEIGRST